MKKKWLIAVAVTIASFSLTGSVWAFHPAFQPGTSLYMRTKEQDQNLTQHYTSRMPGAFPPGSFAMAMTALGESVPAGSLFPAVKVGNLVDLQMPNGSVVEAGPNQVKMITVPLGTKSAPEQHNQKLMLGFADSSTAKYIQDLGQDTLSVLAPMAYQLQDTNGGLSGSLSPAVIQAAHNQQVQVWPIVFSGFNPSLTTSFLTKPAAEFQLLQTIVNLVQTDQLDGINFDFEDMVPADAPRYTTFIKAAATILHTMGKWVSVDVSTPSGDPNWGMVYQRGALAQNADYVVAMTYDESYLGEQTIGSVAPLPWMRSGIQSIENDGVPPAKLLLGIPFYSIDWYRTNGIWHSRYVTMSQEAALEKSPTAHISANAASGQHLLSYTRSGLTHYVWLEDSSSLTARAAYANTANLAGAAVWQVDLGNSSALDTIINAF